MQRLLSALLALLLAGCSPATPAVTREAPPVRAAAELPDAYAPLQGVWTVAHAQRGAVPMTDKTGMRMHFAGNRFWFDGDTGFEVIAIDAAVVPHRIDFWSGGSAVQGIFRIAGGVLSVCTAPPGDPRPTGFDPSRHPRWILSESRRQ
jgi:uncharacterized protein (TIGR03067 family)